MQASDAKIPVIFKANCEKGSVQLKTSFLEFLKHYKNDPNDFGGKIFKIIELMQENGKSVGPLLKALVSKSSRQVLMQITSFWVTEHLVKVLT